MALTAIVIRSEHGTGLGPFTVQRSSVLRKRNHVNSFRPLRSSLYILVVALHGHVGEDDPAVETHRKRPGQSRKGGLSFPET